MQEQHKLILAAAAATAAISIVTTLLFGNRKMKSAGKMTLFYFDLAGKGECIRLACAHAGVALNDTRIPLDNRALFDQMKSEGKLTFGQLPALQLADGTLLTQSSAIMRYIGKVTGLYPSCPKEAALVDAVMDEEIDLFVGLSVSRYKERFGFACLGPSTVATIRASLNDEIIPRHLECLESLMMKSKTGWIANTKTPSIADFVLVPRLQWLISGVNEGISKNILHPFPMLRALIDKLMGLPRIVHYYQGLTWKDKK